MGGPSYYLAKVVYNHICHPLSKYPGPKLASVSDIWYVTQWAGGRWPFIIANIHKGYGAVVRIALTKLSFASPGAFKAIYGHRTKGESPFLKSCWYDTGDVPNIVTALDPLDHARQHWSLAHAFSTKSLKDHEDVIHRYTVLFISQLAKHGGQGTEGINMLKTYNCITFDIITNLALSESFEAMATIKTNYWVLIMVTGAFLGTMIGLQKCFPQLKFLLPFILPPREKQDYVVHRQLTCQKLKRRINQDDLGLTDVLWHILKTGDYTMDGLSSQANILILAGSDTTSSLLARLAYYSLADPEKLAHLQEKVRNSFFCLSQINGDSTNKLPYLHGVIEEDLYLTAPVPFMLQRISPVAMVDGYFVPKGTIVSVDLWIALNHP